MSSNHLLDDTARSEAFFTALPEIPFLKSLETLENDGFYSREFKKNLADYSDFTDRPTATFADKERRDLFEKFDDFMTELMGFMARNLVVEGKVYILKPEIKIRDLKKYAQLQATLAELSSSTKDAYTALAYSLSSTSALPPKRTRVTFNDGVVQLNKIKYEPDSKLTNKLLEMLWPLRETKSKQKDAETITLGNLAVKIGMTESSVAFSKNPKRLKTLIKNTNGYLIKKKLPVHIEIQDDLVSLIVE